MKDKTKKSKKFKDFEGTCGNKNSNEDVFLTTPKYTFTPYTTTTGTTVTWTDINDPSYSNITINKKAFEIITNTYELYQKYIKTLEERIEKLEKENKKLSLKK